MGNKKSRRNIRKALNAIEKIDEKYPNGILDIKTINEEERAWLQLKVQHIRECIKPLWSHFSQSSWWECLRHSRNKTAHAKEDLSDEDFSNLCESFFPIVDNVRLDLKTNIQVYKQQQKKKRKFENTASPESAFGSSYEKKQLVDAIEDAIMPIQPEGEEIEFPDNKFSLVAKNTLSDILNTKEIKDYMCQHEGMSENVQTDILEFLQKTNRILEKENPFLDEEIFIAEQKNKSSTEIAFDISNEKSKIEYHYKRLPSVSDSKRGNIQKSLLDFDFYNKEFNLQKKIVEVEKETIAKEDKTKDIEENSIEWKNIEKLEALKRNFIQDMEKNFIERKNKWEQTRIDMLRKEFLENLYKKIQNFIRLEELVLPFIKDFGRLWDISSNTFATSGFEILETFAKLLEQDESLKELANLLGRQNRVQATFEKELRDKIVIKTEWKAKSAYRGNITGLKYSNDIATSLPNERALLKKTTTTKLFQLKFAQKQLLSFEFQNKDLYKRESIEKEEIAIEKKDPKGPIIICVDTSGSMQGTPENIAKTVTFALTKIALEQMRKCFVISFSTDIETLEVKPNDEIEMTNANNENYLQKLVKFLNMSFNGGTDAEPALRKAIKMLKGEDTTKGYSNADVLMISDFVMDNLSDDLSISIETEKNKKTSFYSLVIGSSGNKNTISCFDYNWAYNTDDIHASRHLAEQLHEMKKKQNNKIK